MKFIFLLFLFLVSPIKSTDPQFQENQISFNENIYSALLDLFDNNNVFKNQSTITFYHHPPSHLMMHDGLCQLAYEADQATGKGGGRPYDASRAKNKLINSVQKELVYLQKKYPHENVGKIFFDQAKNVQRELEHCIHLINNFIGCFDSHGRCQNQKEILLSLIDCIPSCQDRKRYIIWQHCIFQP